MADVEMTDAAAPKVKSSKAVASGDVDGKKRFEVKKVHSYSSTYRRSTR